MLYFMQNTLCSKNTQRGWAGASEKARKHYLDAGIGKDWGCCLRSCCATLNCSEQSRKQSPSRAASPEALPAA